MGSYDDWRTIIDIVAGGRGASFYARAGMRVVSKVHRARAAAGTVGGIEWAIGGLGCQLDADFLGFGNPAPIRDHV